MTVTTTTNKQRTSGNGVTTVFPATIKIFAATDITVTIINSTTDVVINTLILNDGGALGFTVVFDTDAETLSVTTNTAPASGEDIQTLRVLPITQEADFPRASKFPAVSNENALDKNTMVLQDQQEQIDRAITLPVSSSLTDIELATPIALDVIGWNATATALTSFSFGDISTSIDTVFTALADKDIIRFDQATLKWINEDFGEFITDKTDTTITPSDELIFSDATDTNLGKKDTVQGVLDLVAADLSGKADTVITAADKITFYDVTDSDNPKTDTVQGVLDLVLTLGTPAVTTSGTEHDFTIPSGTKKITVNFDGVSLSGTDNYLIQLGDAGGIEATGYTSSGSLAQAGGNVILTSTAGFIIRAASSPLVIGGQVTIALLDSSTNTWTSSGGVENGSQPYSQHGTKSLSAGITTLRITTTGANTFDAGKINVITE